MMEKKCRDCIYQNTDDCCWCDEHENWKAKKEKIGLSTWEMIKALAENPKRKAESVDMAGTVIMSKGCLMWLDGTFFKLTLRYENEPYLDVLNATDWIITEPPKKLKKMSFQEAIKYYSKHGENVDGAIIKSCVSGRSVGDTKIFNFKLEEIDGLWTVDGIYEEGDN